MLEDCLIRMSTGASTLNECLARYPGYVAQLRPLLETADLLILGRDVKPLPTFNAYTHDALVQYVRSHPRQPQIKISVTPVIRRTAFAFAVLLLALLVTGTVHAQSVLPGDTFYGWKRTSEDVWLALSSDPIATEIVLADRRIDEWIMVANDPARSASAIDGYFEVINRLGSVNDKQAQARIVPVLQNHHKKLHQAGLPTSTVDHFLVVVTQSLPVGTVTQNSPTNLPAPVPTVHSAVQPTSVSSEGEPAVVQPQVAPTVSVPTQIVPTVVAPTEIAPTAVPPTEVAPTDVPTEIAPTDVPTEAAPTDVPTEPAPTDVPTEPAATDVPAEPAATDVPTESAPTDVPVDQSTVVTP
jgi:hypothetical protein